MKMSEYQSVHNFQDSLCKLFQQFLQERVVNKQAIIIVNIL